ncbi:hypothetical protein MMC14_000669 [Varicellaria rhodocarpa]|nr:hypothetical protein [Varicellaria rhodocarpa]
MHLLAPFVSSLLLASGALAQYGSYGTSPSSSGSSSSDSGSSSSSSSGDVGVQVVKVSNKNGSLVYSPNNIEAAVGSMVQFQFYPKNHSVTQSTFANPCVPINNIMSSVTGFFSGFMPTSDVSGSDSPIFTLMINDTNPIWFYCSQAKHCQAGMVGAINAPKNSNKTVEAFAALAALAPVNLAPGESSSASGGNSSVSSPTSTGGITTVTTSAASPSIFASSKELLVGAMLASALAAFMAFAM